jgi:V8-like Glu-specific endopeptidase
MSFAIESYAKRLIHSFQLFVKGVKISKTETCDGTTGSSNRKPQHEKIATISTGFISIDVMTKFKEEGFKFVRKVDFNKLNGIVRQPSLMPGADAVKDSSKGTRSRKGAMRMTSEGYEYYSSSTPSGDVSVLKIDSSLGTVASETAPNYHNRSLKVIGDDNRVQITDTSIHPYPTIGALGYFPDNQICSGSVINKAAVLTAAHCVYDSDTQEWAPHNYFAPGRYVEGFYFYDPYGRWYVDYFTIPTPYYEEGLINYDYAVSRLKKDNTKYNDINIGEKVGNVGLATTTGPDDANLQSCSITGYPGELTGGRGMWQSSECPNGYVSPAGIFDLWDPTRIIFFDCDITGGTSGSAILGVDRRVRGVATFEMVSDDYPWNGGVAFHAGNGILASVMDWAGYCTSTCTRLLFLKGVRVYKSSIIGERCRSRCIAPSLVSMYTKILGWKCECSKTS